MPDTTKHQGHDLEKPAHPQQEIKGHPDTGAMLDQEWLVVDLDDTLVCTDMLFETFWSAMSRDARALLPACRAALKGRAPLKQVLATNSDITAADLPYNDAVLDYIQSWRNKGGPVALVSASDQAIVNMVSDHLGLFDTAHGSNGETNLKGPQKARFLREAFPAGFVYVGDSNSDLDVWEHASGAVTVGASPGLRSKVESRLGAVEHLSARDKTGKALLRAIRPHQWIKNVLIFVPMVAAHDLDGVTFLSALIAFVAFSLTASSVYLLNDMLDLAADRKHPRKRFRPFASGTARLSTGSLAIPFLLGAGLTISALLGPMFLFVISLYFAATMAYSFALKRKLVIDIVTLAVLYTLRIIAGGVATGLPPSVWLLAFSIFFFFALAAMKRQAELVSGVQSGEEKAHGRGYRVEDLPLVSSMAVASGYVAVLVFARYLDSDSVQQLYNTPAPLWGICVILLYWISRLLMITHRGEMHDDPVVFAARDQTSRICGLLILSLGAAGVLL